MFSGLCAFPLTPMNEATVDEAAFIRLIERLVGAGVDSLCTLGSTGNYAYLSYAERVHIIRLTLSHTDRVPVLVGISALRTREVLMLAEVAQQAGANGLLLAPFSYQPLSAEEVFSLYETVSQAVSVPLVVCDNPGTTRFIFSDELYCRIAQLPHIASLKIPGIPTDPAQVKARVTRLRRLLPAHVAIGISGDACGAAGLNAGCAVWYSAIGGVFPLTARAITRAAQAGRTEEALRLSARLQPLWSLMQRYGSLRVIATAAELTGLSTRPTLPLPLQTLPDSDRHQLARLIETLALA